ncbi:MAG: hypothetical protein ACFFDH_24230 [Promethearchaeota archaeon]
MDIENEILNIKNILDEFGERIKNIERELTSNPNVQDKKLSIREFLIEVKPKGEIQKTLAFGYYLEIYQRMKSFNVKDIRNCYNKSKEKAPDNINYNIFKNIERGFLMECDEIKDRLKSWCLTHSGIEFINNNFKRINNND